MDENLLPGETNRARRAFEDYAALGAGRSLSQLAQQYRNQTGSRPPTRLISTLKAWSGRFNWQERVQARDAELAQAQREGQLRAALDTGYALVGKRLQDLNSLAELLLAEVLTDDKRWLPDVKQIGSGDLAERVDIVRFNSALIEQYRGVLNDMAMELGQRVKGVELTGKGGGPIQVQDIEAVRRRRWEQVQATLPAALADDDTEDPNA